MELLESAWGPASSAENYEPLPADPPGLAQSHRSCEFEVCPDSAYLNTQIDGTFLATQACCIGCILPLNTCALAELHAFLLLLYSRLVESFQQGQVYSVL